MEEIPDEIRLKTWLKVTELIEHSEKFDLVFAKKHSIQEAFCLQYIQYIVLLNKELKLGEKEGKIWAVCRFDELMSYFPFFTKSVFENAIKNMHRKDIVSCKKVNSNEMLISFNDERFLKNEF